MVSADETVEKIVVKATASVDGSTKSGTAVVTVHNVEKKPTVTSVSIQPHSASVFSGVTLTFTATVTGTGNPSLAVTWSISGGTVAAGTNINANTGVLTVGGGQTPGNTLSVRATSVLDTTKYDTAVVSIIDRNSLKNKFGVTETKAAGVTETFKDVSDFIRGNGLVTNPNRIQLGNYIDLEGGLTVAAYNGLGAFTYSDQQALQPISTPANAEYNPNYSGVLLRLIVVGINSFNGKNGNNTQHIVFQFQNIPVEDKLNAADGRHGGYPASDVRGYLSQVGEAPGNFLIGLNNAGVPQDVLWGPTRMVSDGTNVVSITDKLWLPTEPEMFGINVSPGETAENQAGLEYYTSNNSRIKYTSAGPSNDGKGALYWDASAASATEGENDMSNYFNAVSDSGANNALPGEASQTARGLVPAFCVY
jgi:hypothetical protein